MLEDGFIWALNMNGEGTCRCDVEDQQACSCMPHEAVQDRTANSGTLPNILSGQAGHNYGIVSSWLSWDLQVYM